MNTCDKPADLAIIGAGAAGLAASIFTARRLPSARIIALDSAQKLGAKILVSGGGRCNLTNALVTPDDFSGGSRNIIKKILAAFTANDAVIFFRELGVELHEESLGKLFPNTNKARTVLDALINESTRLGVRLLTDHRVTKLTHDGATFIITTPHRTLAARRVILATGGLSLPKTGSDGSGYRLAQSLGHSLIPTTPALDPLLLEGDFHTALSGITHESEITLHITGEKSLRIRGSMLWTHFGLSGPVALDASRHWLRARIENRDVRLTLNFLPNDDLASLERRLVDAAATQPKSTIKSALAANLAAHLPTRLAESLLAQLAIPDRTPLGQLPKEARRKLAHALTAWPVPIRGTRGYSVAEATAGGIPLSEINPATMQSRIRPSLYLIGEILDVDGRLGGFNFQWAWSTAFVAAAGLAKDLADPAGSA